MRGGAGGHECVCGREPGRNAGLCRQRDKERDEQTGRQIHSGRQAGRPTAISTDNPRPIPLSSISSHPPSAFRP